MTVDMPAACAIFAAVKSAWLWAFACISCMMVRSRARLSVPLIRCFITPPPLLVFVLASVPSSPGWHVGVLRLPSPRNDKQVLHISRPVRYGPLPHSPQPGVGVGAFSWRSGSASLHLQDRSGTIDIHLLALPCSSDTLYILQDLAGARNSRREPG